MKIDKGLLIIIGVTLALFAGLIALASAGNRNPQLLGATQTSNQPSLLTAPEPAFDFGSVAMAKGKVRHTYQIKNPTGSPVIISKLYTSCMCTVTSLIKGEKRFGPFGMPGHAGIPAINEIIEPGQTAEIEAVFDPAAHGPAGIGPIAREVIIEQEDTAPLKLSFKANVTP